MSEKRDFTGFIQRFDATLTGHINGTTTQCSLSFRSSSDARPTSGLWYRRFNVTLAVMLACSRVLHSSPWIFDEVMQKLFIYMRTQTRFVFF